VRLYVDAALEKPGCQVAVDMPFRAKQQCEPARTSGNDGTLHTQCCQTAAAVLWHREGVTTAGEVSPAQPGGVDQHIGPLPTLAFGGHWIPGCA
jgi:hypothetical protein